MDKREKVINGLERCIEKLDTVVNKTHGFNCTACPYFRKCDSSGYLIGLPLMRDALALLKAQEPRVMTLEEVKQERICWIEDADDGMTVRLFPATMFGIGEYANGTKSYMFLAQKPGWQCYAGGA